MPDGDPHNLIRTMPAKGNRPAGHRAFTRDGDGGTAHPRLWISSLWTIDDRRRSRAVDRDVAETVAQRCLIGYKR
jgi:hypothetical protein